MGVTVPDISTLCPARPHRVVRVIFIACLLALVAGCASGGGIVDKTLQAVGIREKLPELPDGERAVELRLFPGDNLNAGTDNRPLALVVRIYRLRSTQRFEQVPFDAFLDEAREKDALGDDLIGVNEIVLLPGKPHTLTERIPADVQALGVVALFRAPARQRWRFTFDSGHKSIAEGITIGLHACAMTTTSAAMTTTLSDDPASLASARCLKSSP